MNQLSGPKRPTDRAVVVGGKSAIMVLPSDYIVCNSVRFAAKSLFARKGIAAGRVDSVLRRGMLLAA